MTSYSNVIGGSFVTSTAGVVDSTSLTVWANELTGIAPGVTANVTRQALRAAFREFCVISGAWIRELPPMDLEAGVGTFSIPEPEDAKILYLLAVGYRQPDAVQNTYTRFLRPLTSPGYKARALTVSSAPWGYTGNSEEPGTISIVPAVDTDMEGAIYPFVALGPKTPYATDIPAFFQTWYFDIILDGAAFKLLSQPNKPYTNDKLAVYYGKRFRAAMARARDMARRQFTTADTAFVFPPWA